MAFLIRVPASTANLGPGFDCLGMALDLWNEVRVEIKGKKLGINIHGFGSEILPRDENNAIYQAMLTYASYLHKSLPPNLNLSCINRIPLSSGLGSSSAAIVSGILAASAILGIPNDREDQIRFASQLEGHPDNVAPCLLGGLVVSMMEGKNVVTRNLAFTPLNLIIATPNFNFPTQVARSVLPKKIKLSDAVNNIGHVIFLVEGLREGNLGLIAAGNKDRLHEPYRLGLIPGAKSAIAAAYAAGASAVMLSGAGPSLISISPDESLNSIISDSIQNSFLDAGLTCKLFFPSITKQGAVILDQ